MKSGFNNIIYVYFNRLDRVWCSPVEIWFILSIYGEQDKTKTLIYRVYFIYFNIKYIFHIVPKTSFGFDRLSTKLLKTVKDALIRPITIIINQMLNIGIFPDNLKLAKIIPVYKKDDQSIFGNYRPISLLTTISEVFEKVIFKQLYQFF